MVAGTLSEVSHVVLLELPEASGDYLHLAGRTGRMGRLGRAIAICTEAERRNVARQGEEGSEFDDGLLILSNFSEYISV